MSSASVDTRQRILTAARSLIEERGYDVGLGEIGKRAGISRQAVYLHFASKAQLLTELVTWIEKQADLGSLLAPVWSAPTGEQALRALIDAGAAFEPRIHAIARVTEQARDHDPIVAAIVADRMQQRFEGMRAVISRIHAEDRLAPGWDIDTATAFLWALTASSTYQLLVVGHGWTPEQWARHTHQLLHDALIRPGGDHPAPPETEKPRPKPRRRPTPTPHGTASPNAANANASRRRPS